MRISTTRTLILAGTILSAAAAVAGSFYNIEDMSGWQHCGACAGIGASGPVGTFWMKQHISSPSLDGSSAQFYLGGKSYADALWWRQLGANSAASRFTYELYFFVHTPAVGQALEFDVNQGTGGHKYIFGTECDTRNGHVWKVWSGAGHSWVNTGIACYPAAFKWNHLVIQVERVSGKTHFVSISLNGNTRYVNKYYSPIASSSNELNVAFQMDLNNLGQGYSIWLDKVRLSF